MSSVRPSVRPSVCLSLESLETNCMETISPTPSLFIAQRSSTYSQVNMGNVETTGGVGKSGVLDHISGNISETRKDRKSHHGGPTGN